MGFDEQPDPDGDAQCRPWRRGQFQSLRAIRILGCRRKIVYDFSRGTDPEPRRPRAF
jgi:hypothetical protein